MKIFVLSLIICLLCPYSFAQTTGTFKDTRDSKSYKTVKIGEQWWFAENLNYSSTNSVCYNNSQSNCEKYGRLYTYDEASEVCPTGWHLPSYEEWGILKQTVNKNGLKLLAKGESWMMKSGTDDFGFSILGAGAYQSGDKFSSCGITTYFWDSYSKLWIFSEFMPEFGATTPQDTKVEKTYVRCIKNK